MVSSELKYGAPWFESQEGFVVAFMVLSRTRISLYPTSDPAASEQLTPRKGTSLIGQNRASGVVPSRQGYLRGKIPAIKIVSNDCHQKHFANAGANLPGYTQIGRMKNIKWLHDVTARESV